MGKRKRAVAPTNIYGVRTQEALDFIGAVKNSHVFGKYDCTELAVPFFTDAAVANDVIRGLLVLMNMKTLQP